MKNLLRTVLWQISLQYKLNGTTELIGKELEDFMGANTSGLTEIERATYRSRWQDGSLDLCGGLGVLFTGAAWESEVFWAPGFAVPVLIILWSVLRSRLVEPRIGRVTFGRERRERERGATRGAVWFGVGLLALVVGYYFFQTQRGIPTGRGLETWIAGLPVALLGVMALLTAAMLSLPRFVLYSLALVSAGILGVLLGLEPGHQILSAGAVITLSGLALLGRFVVTHPKPVEGGSER